MSVEILWVHRFKWITELSSNCESRAPSRWWSASVILFHVLGAGHFCPFCSRRKMDGAAAIELEWNLKKCSISSTATYQKFSFIFTATWREKKIRKVYVTGHNSELVDQDVDPPLIGFVESLTYDSSAQRLEWGLSTRGFSTSSLSRIPNVIIYYLLELYIFFFCGLWELDIWGVRWYCSARKTFCRTPYIQLIGRSVQFVTV